MKKEPKAKDSKPKQDAKSRAKKETKSEQSKEAAKREVVASSRRSKRKNAEHDWDAWDDVAGEWDEHWEEEWGEDWGWSGWNDQDKMWDKAVWQDGKSSLHALRTNKGKGQEVEAPAPAKRIKGKQSMENIETTSPETKPAKAPKAKSEPKKKTPAKQDVDDPAKHKPAAKAKSAPEHVESTRTGRDSKILSDSEQVLVEFGKEYKAMGDDYENAKDALKELKSLQTTECVFNCYWKRPAVGVKSVSKGKDFAYFMFGGENQRPLRMAIAMKTAHLLVTCLNLFDVHVHVYTRICACGVIYKLSHSKFYVLSRFTL